jgi:glycosyltransferase involved in cell wall biosynthesis
MNSSLQSISVIVPTRNRDRLLPELLEALASEPVEEIVVVVNSSDDESRDVLARLAATEPRLKHLWINEASQFRALQAAAEEARGEILLMLDDDVIPKPGMVEGHSRHHVEADDLVVVGYMPVELPSRRRRREYPLYQYSRAYENTCAEYERDPTAILRSFWAGNVSIRRDNALRVGLSPSADLPGPYTNHRDRDFGLRCQEAGLRGLFDRNLRATHKHQRPPAGYARSAKGSGYNRWVVHRLHADELGDLPEDCYQRGLRFPAGLLVCWARRGWARPPIQLLLRQVAALAGRLHLFRIESFAGHLTGTIERQRGMQEAIATLGPRPRREARVPAPDGSA